MSQTADNNQEGKSQQIFSIEKMLQRLVVLQFILYITIKGGGLRRDYFKNIGGRLGRWEKATWRKFWDWIKSKMETHILLLHWWVQDT